VLLYEFSPKLFGFKYSVKTGGSLHLVVGICKFVTETHRRGSRNFWWGGDDMDEEKIGRGLGPL
jgi:hypothetical protein